MGSSAGNIKYPGRYETQFWNKVDIRGPNQCWPWKGFVHKRLNRFMSTHKGVKMHASRKAWILTHGEPINHVLHGCDNGMCCNPAHTYDGTSQQNSDDMVRRKRNKKRQKLTAEKVVAIRKAYVKRLRWSRRGYQSNTMRDLARKYGVALATIKAVLNRTTWKTL